MHLHRGEVKVQLGGVAGS